MDFINQFTQHDSGPYIQFIKYAIGGTVATVTHITLFHLSAWKIFPCLQQHDFAVQVFNLSTPHLDDSTRSRNSMIDNTIGFVFANFVAYIINIYWVFKPGRHSFLIEISLFYLVSGVSIAIGTGLMGFLIKKYGIRTTYAFGSNLVTSVMINYAMRKFVIFNG